MSELARAAASGRALDRPAGGIAAFYGIAYAVCLAAAGVVRALGVRLDHPLAAASLAFVVMPAPLGAAVAVRRLRGEPLGLAETLRAAAEHPTRVVGPVLIAGTSVYVLVLAGTAALGNLLDFDQVGTSSPTPRAFGATSSGLLAIAVATSGFLAHCCCIPVRSSQACSLGCP